jgi:Winged helix-turn helix
LIFARFVRAAGAGEMLNIHDLKAAYEQAIGHPTSNSTVYNFLDRHGWRKLMPRPFHPKRNLAAQDAFKKTAFQLL